MELQLLVTIFVTAIISSAGITPLILRVASVYSLYDHPDHLKDGGSGRKIHSRPIPRLGGISIFLSFLICFFVWKSKTVVSASMVVSSLLIFLLGVLDDLVSISARIRFVLQSVISCFAVISAGLVITSIPILPGIDISLPWWLGLIISTFVVVGAINSLNMIDGLDGLAGGVSIISLALLSYLYYLLTQDLSTIIYLSLPIIGAVIGFLKYNTHPATIFMGDSGSNWLGFVIGVQFLMVLKKASEIAHNVNVGDQALTITLASVVMCFSVPIFDTAFVIISRLKSGLPPMAADKRHFHHSLMQIGLSQSQSVTVIYFLCILSGFAGLSPLLYPQHPMSLVPFLGGILVFLVIGFALAINTKCRDTILYYANIISPSNVKESRGHRLLIKGWERVNKYCLFIILVISPVFAGNIPQTIGYVAIPVAILLFTTFILKSHPNDFFESLTIGLACFTLLAANNQNPLKVEFLKTVYSIQPLYNGLFIFLFISSLGFLFTTIRQKHLILNASDFLMLSIPLLLTMLPTTFRAEFRIDIISLRCIVIFLCYRSLEKRRAQARRHIKLAASFALIYLIAASIGGLHVIY